MAIIKIPKNCLISEDQDSITLSLPDNSFPEDQDNPWEKYAGMFEDDPQFEEFLSEIESYRRQLDNEAEESQG